MSKNDVDLLDVVARFRTALDELTNAPDRTPPAPATGPVRAPGAWPADPPCPGGLRRLGSASLPIARP